MTGTFRIELSGKKKSIEEIIRLMQTPGTGLGDYTPFLKKPYDYSSLSSNDIVSVTFDPYDSGHIGTDLLNETYHKIAESSPDLYMKASYTLFAEEDDTTVFVSEAGSSEVIESHPIFCKYCGKDITDDPDADYDDMGCHICKECLDNGENEFF